MKRLFSLITIVCAIFLEARHKGDGNFGNKPIRGPFFFHPGKGHGEPSIFPGLKTVSGSGLIIWEIRG